MDEDTTKAKGTPERQHSSKVVLCEGLSLRTTIDLYNRLYIGQYGLMAKGGLPEGQWTDVIVDIFLDLQTCIQELNRLKLPKPTTNYTL